MAVTTAAATTTLETSHRSNLCSMMTAVAWRTSQLDHIPHFVTESAQFAADLLRRDCFSNAAAAAHVNDKVAPLLTRRRVVYAQLLWCLQLSLRYIIDHEPLTPDERDQALYFDEGVQVLSRLL